MILGCYASNGEQGFKLTKRADEFDQSVGGKLRSLLAKTTFTGKTGSPVAFYELLEKDPVIVVGLGQQDAGYDPVEEIDAKKENIRVAIGHAAKMCKTKKISTLISVDDCGDAKAVAEALFLSIHSCDEFKTEKAHRPSYNLISKDPEILKQFEEGKILADSQVFARKLGETPANKKYPTLIAELAKKELEGLPNVTCIVRDKEWIESQKMGIFLSVAQGSEQPPVLMEVHYKGSSSDPIMLVGKGITFDTGGISLKPPKSMSDMKMDMGGAACCLGSLRAASLLGLPLHLIVIIPFTENMPSGRATKPGDVFTSMSGITVEVDNTDAEGRLVLGDALTYAQTFKPSEIIDLATLTGAMRNTFGGFASGFFTSSPQMKDGLKQAAAISGDRMWHMPLGQAHIDDVKSEVADIINIGKSGYAGSCTAAAFLKHFVSLQQWTHIDIAGVAGSTPGVSFSYMEKGTTGRPTRTIIEYLKLKVASK